MSQKTGCPSSPITATASVPPWERDRSNIPVVANGNPYKAYSHRPKKKSEKKPPKIKKRHEFVRPDYGEYMASKKWKRKRSKAIARAGHKCEHCHAENVTLEVHHKTYARLGREQPSDLVALCGPCHSLQHESKYPARDPLSVEFRRLVRSF